MGKVISGFGSRDDGFGGIRKPWGLLSQTLP
jgi:hypothetical protein